MWVLLVWPAEGSADRCLAIAVAQMLLEKVPPLHMHCGHRNPEMLAPSPVAQSLAGTAAKKLDMDEKLAGNKLA